MKREPTDRSQAQNKTGTNEQSSQYNTKDIIRLRVVKPIIKVVKSIHETKSKDVLAPPTKRRSKETIRT